MIEETEQPAASQPAPQFAAVNQPSDLRQLFFGAEGLRPAWAFVAYVAMFIPLLRLLSALAARVEFGSGRELWAMPLSEFAVLLAAVLPALVMGGIERRPWGSFGLPAKSAFGRLFWIGAAWGFAGITLLLGILYGLHAFDFDIWRSMGCGYSSSRCSGR